jgi:hypothetical protein|tara:strand:+ start:787 stop:987 length:201 start_codon:yes stop_codon:yes gene_type:complete
MNDKTIAKQSCANYGKGDRSGICSAYFFKREESGKLVFWLDKKYRNKECAPSDCSYFKNIVLPGVK